MTELPEEVAGCEDCLRDGRRLAAPAHLPRVRARRLLRRLAQPSRERARRRREHPIIRSLEPGEDWCWCFEDDLAMRIPQITGETRSRPRRCCSGVEGLGGGEHAALACPAAR